MILKEESTQIAYMQKTHGVKGELVLTLGEGIYSEELDPEFLLLDIDNGLVPFYVESYRVKSSKNMLVKLESVDNENKAKEMVGVQVYVETAMLETEGELPSAAFVGFRVTDKQKGDIGVISEIQEISNNPLFVIDFEGNEILIPINPDFILNVNEKDKTMQVDLPEGLIDLYLEEE